jgi:hypothetical protein
LRAGALTREKTESPLPKTAINAKTPSAKTKFLRDFMAKILLRPIRPEMKQGLSIEFQLRKFAGGTRGQRAAQVKPLEEYRNIHNSNSTKIHSFASAISSSTRRHKPIAML